jgi:hypothetical protein
MKKHANAAQEEKSHSVANCLIGRKSNVELTFRFVDNRPEAKVQEKLQQLTHGVKPAMQRKVNVVQQLPTFKNQEEAIIYFEDTMLDDMESHLQELELLKQIAIKSSWSDLLERISYYSSESKVLVALQINQLNLDDPSNVSTMKRLLTIVQEKGWDDLEEKLLPAFRTHEDNQTQVDQAQQHDHDDHEEEIQLADIQSIFTSAIKAFAQPLHRVVGLNQEELVMQALFLATKNILFYMQASGGIESFPSLDELNSKDDLQSARDKLALRPRTPSDDNYDHVYIRKYGNNPIDIEDKKRIVQDDRSLDEPLQERMRLDAEKSANTWLKVAMPYVELKVAFRDGWEENDHGSFEKRGFYYLLKNKPIEAYKEMTGTSDITSGITEPVSGKVALAQALKDVFNTVACHEDAIQFVNLLGGKTIGSGILKDSSQNDVSLPAAKRGILQLLEMSKAPLVGVRLRDSGQHSLVLLFERSKNLGLQGRKYETIASHNAEQILFYDLKPLKLIAANELLGQGLQKAVQFSRQGWEFEWQVFEISSLDILRSNLFQKINATIEGVHKGVTEHEKGHIKQDELMGEEMSQVKEAREHVDTLVEGRPEYLREKQKRQQHEKIQHQQHVQENEELKRNFCDKLNEVKSKGPEHITVVLKQIYESMGEAAVFSIAAHCGIKFEKVIELLPELA